MPKNTQKKDLTGINNSVKVWDIRNSFPLSTIETHIDKVFTLGWNSKISF